MKEFENLTRQQIQTLIATTKGMSAGGAAAHSAIERSYKLTKSEQKAFERLGDQFERDASMLRDPGWHIMLLVAEARWPDLLKRLMDPESYAGVSYPLRIDEVGTLLRQKGKTFPSNSTLRRLADVVGAPRLGVGAYRVFFATHVLHAAFLSLSEGNPEDEVNKLERFGSLDWTPREAAILLRAPNLDPYIRKNLESFVVKALAPRKQPKPAQRHTRARSTRS